jgi:hypothetical protein
LCEIVVDFKPTSVGPKEATLNMPSDASNGAQAATLTGTGVLAGPSSIAPTSNDFGSVAVSGEASQWFTFRNDGVGFTSGTATITGTDADQFQIAVDECSDVYLPYVDDLDRTIRTCVINVAFNPTSAGGKSATLSVPSGASNSPSTASLTGTGTTAPASRASVSPATWDFGLVRQYTSSNGKTFTVTNTGDANLYLYEAEVSWEDDGRFYSSDGCYYQVLAPTETCDIQVQFIPYSTGAETGTLTVYSDAANGTQSASLSGTGYVPTVSLSPGDYQFGSHLIGTTSPSHTWTLTNTGLGPLHVTSATVYGNGFTASSDECSGETLAPAGSCDVEVVFQAFSVGNWSGQLSIGNDTGTQYVYLYGQVPPPEISMSPATQAFGTQAAGSLSGAHSFVVTNIGFAPLTIVDVRLMGSNPGSFGIDTNGCFEAVIAPSNSCTIDVVFSPTGTGPRSALLAVESDDYAHFVMTSSLTGTGTGSSTSVGASIKILLDSSPNAATDFAFSGDLGAFPLDDDASAALPNQRTFSGLAAGDYTITQANTAKWSLTDLACNTPQTIDLTHRTVTIHVGASSSVVCSFTDAKRQPDAMIATASGGPYAGSNLYPSSPIAGRTKNVAVAQGQTRILYVSIQNDSPKKDAFLVDGNVTGSSTFAVAFYRGGVNITTQVLAGTYSISYLAAGAAVTIQVRVTATALTPVGAVANVDVIATSKSAPAATDMVRGHITRT